MKKTKILCIQDGFGLSPQSKGNPFGVANIPNIKNLFNKNPWITLDADGESSGQENGLVGNSEVGHMNMGALKLVKQLSLQITESSKNQYDLDSNYPDQKFDPKDYLEDGGVVHLIGLFSEGTIHSDLRHWIGAIEAAGQKNMTIVLHLISDGRDSSRDSFGQTWSNFVEKYSEKLKDLQSKILLGSVGGRFFGMDRDNNRDRIEKYLEALQKKSDGIEFEQILQSIGDVTRESYQNQVYDEILQPTGYKGVEENEIVWFLNFRTDRMKQLVKAFCKWNQKENLGCLVLANNNYGIDLECEIDSIEDRKGYYPVFANRVVEKTLSEFVAKKGQTQLHIAETEKYNHVTYFFNGGSSNKQEGEDWVVIDSNKIDSHAQKPEMKAVEVTDYIIENGLGKYDYIIVNYANCDMVGHTGDFDACVKTLEVIDEQVGRLVKKVEEEDHKMIFTADHGNIEMVGEIEEGVFDTKHNPNPVPLILVGDVDVIDTVMGLNSHLENSGVYSGQVIKEFIDCNGNLNLGEGWMREDQIKKPLLPIWMVGLFLINL